VLVGRPGDEDAAWFAGAFQPRRDVDSLAQNIVSFDQYVAEMDAHSVKNAFALRLFRVALNHQPLDRDGAFYGVDHGGELQQEPVAHRLDDPAASASDQRPSRVAMRAHRPRRPRLVLAHEAGIADDVDGHDRGEFAGLGHFGPQAGEP
jgi:hypothetical protein